MVDMRITFDKFLENIRCVKYFINDIEIIIHDKHYAYYGDTVKKNIKLYVNTNDEIIKVKTNKIEKYDGPGIDGDVIVFNNDYYYDIYFHMICKLLNVKNILDNEFYFIVNDISYTGKKLCHDVIMDSDYSNNLKIFIECLNILDDIKSIINLSFNNLTIKSFCYRDELLCIRKFLRSSFELTIGSNKKNTMLLFTNKGVDNNRKFLNLKKDLVFKKSSTYIQFKISEKNNKLKTLIESSYYRYYDIYTFIISCFHNDEFYDQYLNSKELRDIYLVWLDDHDICILENRLKDVGFRRSLMDIESINLFLQMDNIRIML